MYHSIINDHKAVVETLHGLEKEVYSVVDLCVSCISEGNKLIFAGNGGSASDCLHISAEFTGRFIKDRRPLPALTLSVNMPEATSISNDYSFDEVFDRPLRALGNKGDIFFAVSTSGNSTNLIKTMATCKSLEVFSVGLLGNDGGAIAKLCDKSIIVPSTTTARIQECHILIGHILCEMVEQKMGLVT